MREPNEIISLARQGSARPDWQVFTRKRGTIGAFFRGTSHDPDPMLVVTTDGVVEYVDQKKPLIAVDFGELESIELQANATTQSDTAHAYLHAWLDLHYQDGRQAKWQPSSFKDDLRILQSFIEAHAIYRVWLLQR
jgi:hypothetical protein